MNAMLIGDSNEMTIALPFLVIYSVIDGVMAGDEKKNELFM